MKFIDLFAGLGGFHLALRKLGHQCVFACEVDPILNELYSKNFRLKPEGDIKDVNVGQIPKHDILCAGFPCQPFSQAGYRRGFNCPNKGDLFNHVIKILHAKKPNYFILENVPHLKKHDDGRTWQKMERDLCEAGYQINEDCFSPHQFGIPQIRRRMFIVGSRFGQANLPKPPACAEPNVRTILDRNPADVRQLPDHVKECLEIWQEFLERFPKNIPLPSFPIWSMEFGANYPFEETTPHVLGTDRLRENKYYGNHGTQLAGLSADKIWESLPSYARRRQQQFPPWKIRFIQQNRKLYQDQKRWIDDWIPKIEGFCQSYQKFEWNCGDEKRDIWKLVIQLRPSGVRVKKPTTAPSLVAMSNSQVPIVGWEKRYMTRRECALLQSIDIDNDIILPETPTRAFTALGNAVNVDLVKNIVGTLVYHATNSPQPIRCCVDTGVPPQIQKSSIFLRDLPLSVETGEFSSAYKHND